MGKKAAATAIATVAEHIVKGNTKESACRERGGSGQRGWNVEGQPWPRPFNVFDHE